MIPQELVNRVLDAGGKLEPYREEGRIQSLVQSMVTSWHEIDDNYDCVRDLGQGETPEEEVRYYERLAGLGEAIALFAELFLEERT